MGCAISRQVKFLLSSETVLTYQDKDLCASSGEPLDVFYEQVNAKHFFATCTADIFEEVIEKRKDIIAAKLKFKEMDVETIKNRYPTWTDDMILDLKAQFQSLDLNLDGLIDFPELCDALTELGDNSSEQQKRAYFEEMDEDNSGAIDFEEYLALIHKVLSGQSKRNKIGQIATVGSENASKLRQLSIVQLIDCGLF